MRRRRCSVAASLVAAGALLMGSGSAVRAQDMDGALFLLLPVGARAVALGQAVVADVPGSEAVWWNPAGLARAVKREAAIHHSDSFIGQGDAVSLVIPSSLFGVFTASLNILNFGEQDVTEGSTGAKIGEILVRSIVYAGTYATPLGDHLNAGITYKVVQFRFDCSGLCPDAAATATTSGIDIGMQYDFGQLMPLALGVAVRNFGPRLQVNDTEQADQIPTRVQVGARYRLGGFDGAARDAKVHLMADVADAARFDAPATYLGMDVVWQERLHLRSGYSFEGAEASGLSLGIGLVTGSLVLDVARLFEGFSADAGRAPTYLSLRYLF